MKNKQVYSIGSEIFRTKKDCLTYTRKMIYSLGCCHVTKSHPEYLFFVELLKNHPDENGKKGIGIDFFVIQPNAFNKNNLETLIQRVDGSRIDFSWNLCCAFKKKTNIDKLIRAMRSAISGDIIRFKQEAREAHPLICCKYCQKQIKEEKDFHVDHETPSFYSLKNTFLETHPTRPIDFDEDPKYHSTVFKKEDKEFETKWKCFHTSFCNLQILCKKCNLQKKKK